MKASGRKKPATRAQKKTMKKAMKKKTHGTRQKRGKSRKKTRTVLGQAEALHGKLWVQWTQHVKRVGPSWLFVAITLSHMFCCRITEILSLQAGDFNVRHRFVKINPLKRQPEAVFSTRGGSPFFYKKLKLLQIVLRVQLECLCPAQVKKCILSAVFPKLQMLKQRGVKVTRKRSCGGRGVQKVIDSWTWPKQPGGFLFPSARGGHMKKDAACHSIVKARKTFECSLTDTSRVRSHSGRHRMINDLKSSCIPADAGMFFARMKDKKTWASYGQLTPTQCTAVLEKNQDLKGALRKVYK